MRRILAGLFLLFCSTTIATAQSSDCVNGLADGFACDSVSLEAFMTSQEVGAGPNIDVNDIWGWTDSQTGKEYALVGRRDGVGFVDVTDPTNPVYVANLPTNTEATIWRDIKVYSDHAYVVADAAGAHGMQVVDLTQLRSISSPPATLTPVTIYTDIGSAHNIVINEETGYAYSVGSSGGVVSCGGALHMIDITTPASPTFAGCFADGNTGRSGTGYTHDAQCVIYNGPDTEHVGKEICFGANETDISIADVSTKTAPVPLSAATYPGAAYVHQGWLTEDHVYFYQNDEGDEGNGAKTKTIIWDVTDLDDPVVAKIHEHAGINIDHNLYIVGDFMYQSHYTQGLRITSIADRENPVEVAFFDTWPTTDNASFGGSWSNYPFFASGNIIVSSDNGLFILSTSVTAGSEGDPSVVESSRISSVYPNPFLDSATIEYEVDTAQHVDVTVYNMLGREVRQLFAGQVAAGSPQLLTFEAQDLPSGSYIVVVKGERFRETSRVALTR